MENLKSFAATLTTILIFMSAVEILAPDKKFKKYISFVLGLILISTILNPIVQFISNGEKNVLEGIENYKTVFSAEQNKVNIDGTMSYEGNRDNEDVRKQAFINNFNKNCESILENHFKNIKFKADVECDVDFNNINISIKKLRIGIRDSKVKKIQKVEIGNDKNEQADEKDKLKQEYKDVVRYASDELEIAEEKIEIYILEE
ncbi:stage III sporulation protein AF [uncultured Clostridium sp.]|uniref:stage III sporulation protein AF n=1 Tax=uncultured Clostridium sp. TaxID=59620 RepID=UPI0025D6ECB4|nr:stage III sporulation protein AF [uncultured Clostridium sp.]